MAPVLYHYNHEPAPFTFPVLLCSIWLRLYPNGEDPVYQVFREKLAGSVFEYHAEAFLTTTSDIGSYSRSSKGETAPTPELAIQFVRWRLLLTCASTRSRCRLIQVSFTTPPCRLRQGESFSHQLIRRVIVLLVFYLVI